MSKHNPTPPRFPLTTSMEIADAVHRSGRSNIKDLAVFLNRKPSGALREAVSSAVKYGLIGYATSSGNGLRTTELYRKIIESRTTEEKATALSESFLMPPLFALLVSENAYTLPNDRLIALIKFSGVDIAKISSLANTFLANALLVGLIQDNTGHKVQQQLFDKSSTSIVPQEAIMMATEAFDKHSHDEEMKDDQINSPKNSTTTSTSESIDPWKIQIRLPNKRVAELVLPADLSTKDYEIIKAQLEVLRLYTENS